MGLDSTCTKERNQNAATIFDNLPEDYRRKLMKSIIAFEIEIQSLEHVFKLSQNRDKESYGHIRQQQGNCPQH